MTLPVDREVTGLLVLSMLMFDGRDDREILDVAVSAIPSFGPCRVVATYLTGDGGVLRAPDGRLLGDADVERQLLALDGADGPVTSTAAAWVRAFALRSVGGSAGYLVVAADEEPSDNEQLLLRMLAQQTGTAVVNADLQRRERETAAELRRVNHALTVVNDQLSASVVDLERRRRIHDVLIAVATSGGGERGIAAAVHDLTGLPVVVEDNFGNLRAWAGTGRPAVSDRSIFARHDEALARPRAAGRPVRDRDHVVALARPHDEVLGVLALIDPDHRVGEHELVALEEGAVVLAMELAHLRGLAETELRLRRDLVDDLLSGTDDESALSRAAALGHDLTTPQQVLLVNWVGGVRADLVEQAVEQAVATTLRTPALFARRPDGVAAIVTRTAQEGSDRWHELYDAVADRLRSPSGSVGVGGVAIVPSQVHRSYDEARRALRIRQAATVPAGVTAYEELGIYRLLATGDVVETERFVREWLGALLDYDEVNHTELVRTLWQYYECGGNYDSTADALVIHRSTLRYRLRRIRELTGHDLNSVDSKLNLHVATRAWRLLGPARDEEGTGSELSP